MHKKVVNVFGEPPEFSTSSGAVNYRCSPCVGIGNRAGGVSDSDSQIL